MLKHEFVGNCKKHDLKVLNVILDVITRWNSTFDMIERALMYDKALADTLKFLQDNESKLADEDNFDDDDNEIDGKIDSAFIDWQQMELLKKFLEGFKALTCAASGSKYVTISSALSYYSIVDMSLQEYMKISSGAIKEAAKAMHKKLLQYYNKTSEVICICAVLDPNRKLKDFEDDSEYAEQTKKNLQLIYNTYKLKITKENNELEENVTECEVSSPEEDDSTKCDQIWERAMKAHNPKKGKKLGGDDVYDYNSISVEIINYLKDDSGYTQEEVNLKAKDWFMENTTDTHKDTENMLSWWKENKLRYPVLSVMARDYLAITASAVPCESTFSGGRRTIRWDRSRLSPETVQAVETFKSWSKDFDLEDSFQK